MSGLAEWLHAQLDWAGLLNLSTHSATWRAGATHLVTWPATEFDPNETDCFTIGDQIWIWQPEVGAVRFSFEEPRLHAYRWPGADEDYFRQVVSRSWLPAIYPLWGRQVLHASSLVCPVTGDALAFIGPTHAGKSTTAYGVARRGSWRRLSDDTIGFSIVSGRPHLHPLPNESRLRPASADYYGVEPLTREPISWPAGPVCLKGVYVLEGDESQLEAAAFTALRAADALPALLQQAFTLSFELPKYNQQLMKDYLALVSAIPVFRLRYRRRFDAAEELFASIEAHAASVAGVSCPAGASTRIDE